MRSRYTAYCRKDWTYLLNTLHPRERQDKSETEMAAGLEDAVWKKLEIFESRNGGFDDHEGSVTFAATYTQNDAEKVLHESARFIKEQGQWFYSSERSKTESAPRSPTPSTPFVRDKPKIGRNDPCSCGSGKKFKKCCGR